MVGFSSGRVNSGLYKDSPLTATFVFNGVGCGFWLQCIATLLFFFSPPFLNHSFGSDTCFKYPASSPFCFTFLFLTLVFLFSCGFSFIFSAPAFLAFRLSDPQVPVPARFFPWPLSLGRLERGDMSRVPRMVPVRKAPLSRGGLLSAKPCPQVLSGSPL